MGEAVADVSHEARFGEREALEQAAERARTLQEGNAPQTAQRVPPTALEHDAVMPAQDQCNGVNGAGLPDATLREALRIVLPIAPCGQGT